jgi:hypothetical protein
MKTFSLAFSAHYEKYDIFLTRDFARVSKLYCQQVLANDIFLTRTRSKYALLIFDVPDAKRIEGNRSPTPGPRPPGVPRFSDRQARPRVGVLQ